MNNSASLLGNVSYCKEILEVSLLTVFSTTALGYLLLPPVEGTSAFRSTQCEYAQSWLLYSSSSWCSLLSPFPLFSICSFSSITSPALFFSQIYQLLLRQIKFLQCWNSVFLLSRHMEKNIPLKQILKKKIEQEGLHKSLIKMSLGCSCLQTNLVNRWWVSVWPLSDPSVSRVTQLQLSGQNCC